MKGSLVSRLLSACGVRGAVRSGQRPRSDRIRMLYQPSKVRLFIKPYCPWCVQAMDWLDEHDIAYEVLNVIVDDKAYAEMYRLSGQTAAPVIEVDGHVLADFGAREIDSWWNTLESPRNSDRAS